MGSTFALSSLAQCHLSHATWKFVSWERKTQTQKGLFPTWVQVSSMALFSYTSNVQNKYFRLLSLLLSYLLPHSITLQNARHHSTHHKNFKTNNNKHKRVESTRPIRTQGQENRLTSPCFKTLLQSPMILSFQHLSCWSLWVMGFLFYQGFL